LYFNISDPVSIYFTLANEGRGVWQTPYEQGRDKVTCEDKVRCSVGLGRHRRSVASTLGKAPARAPRASCASVALLIFPISKGPPSSLVREMILVIRP